MIQIPINLREPALNLRDGLVDRAGGRPLRRKDLRADLREPAQSNRLTRARAHARACDPAIRTNAQVRAGVRRCSGSFPATSAAEARGNRRESIQSLLSCPVRFWVCLHLPVRCTQTGRSGFWPACARRAAPGRAPVGRGATDATRAYRATSRPPVVNVGWCAQMDH